MAVAEELDFEVAGAFDEFFDEQLGAADEAVREGVAAGQPQVPASYLSSRVVTPPGWESVPGAYLAFGQTYALEVALAREWEWPVLELGGGHLNMLVDPDGVADAITRLADWARAGSD